MNELETRLRDALQTAREHNTGSLSGPALRRAAHRRTLRTRTGGVAVVGAAAVAGIVVAPGLLETSPSQSPHPSVGAAQTSAASKTAGADPAGKAQPSASFTAKPTSDPTPSSTLKPTPSVVASSAGKVPVQDSPWSPAGALINDATVLAVAPKMAATDTDWKDWGGQLLAQDTVHVVFADRVPIDSTWLEYPRPLVIITGRTSTDSPTLRIAALTTVAGGVDSTNLNSLTVDAMTSVPADGPQAIAVSTGMAIFVAAEAGVDSATYTYTDATGVHTAAMKVADGVATALTPMADLKASPDGKITNVKAFSHGKVVWDAAPVLGR